MSNQPSSWELLLVPDGMKKVSVEMDTRVPNAATFLIKREDHTLVVIINREICYAVNYYPTHK